MPKSAIEKEAKLLGDIDYIFGKIKEMQKEFDKGTPGRRSMVLKKLRGYYMSLGKLVFKQRILKQVNWSD